jgi:transcriptional regulator with XRE-family HTH domain
VLPGSCRAIGAQLTAARETRQLSVEALASQLLLSKGQILGLEQADPSAFYSTDYFLRGLRKYMAYLDLPSDLLDESDEAEDDGGLRLMLADSWHVRASATPSRAHRWATSGVATAVVLVAASAFYLYQAGWLLPSAAAAPDTVSLSAESALPSQPIQPPSEPPSPVRAEPASAVVADGDPDSMVRVSVGKATWVFIRYPDNRVVERRLAAGEELEVGPMPVFLAVGTADSVEVRVENKPVALEPYIRNGQVRLTRPDLARLVP